MLRRTRGLAARNASVAGAPSSNSGETTIVIRMCCSMWTQNRSSL